MPTYFVMNFDKLLEQTILELMSVSTYIRTLYECIIKFTSVKMEQTDSSKHSPILYFAIRCIQTLCLRQWVIRMWFYIPPGNA